MKKLFTILVITAVATIAMAGTTGGDDGGNPIDPPVGQNKIDNLPETPPAQTGSTSKADCPAPTDQSQSDQGITIVNIANNYFEAKGDYVRACNCGDTVRAHKARTRMANYQKLIDNFKAAQATRDHNQDIRMNEHGKLLHQQEKYNQTFMSDIKGLQKGQEDHETRIKALETEGGNFALLNLPARISYHTWWLVILTILIIITGFRRYRIR